LTTTTQAVQLSLASLAQRHFTQRSIQSRRVVPTRPCQPLSVALAVVVVVVVVWLQ
jgi:hypothetical protein